MQKVPNRLNLGMSAEKDERKEELVLKMRLTEEGEIHKPGSGKVKE